MSVSLVKSYTGSGYFGSKASVSRRLNDICAYGTRVELTGRTRNGFVDLRSSIFIGLPPLQRRG